MLRGGNPFGGGGNAEDAGQEGKSNTQKKREAREAKGQAPK